MNTHTEGHTHGRTYLRRSILMEGYTHGGTYSRRDILTEGHSHGGTFSRRKILTEGHNYSRVGILLGGTTNTEEIRHWGNINTDGRDIQNGHTFVPFSDNFAIAIKFRLLEPIPNIQTLKNKNAPEGTYTCGEHIYGGDTREYTHRGDIYAVGICTAYIRSGRAHEGTYTRRGYTHGVGIYIVQNVWISKQKMKMRSYTQVVFMATVG